MANTADFLGERRMTFSDANILIALYKGLLGREPDAKGMAFHLNKIENGEALDVLVSAFVNSMEFVQGFTSRANMYALDGAPPMEVDLDLTPEQSSRLWENVKQEWSRMGDAEPYHSVLTDPKWASANMTSQEIVDAFYETGRGDMNRLDKWLARAGTPLPKTSICAEYGCGVGRSTIWLARRYERVLAMDISEPHLALARARAAKEGLTNIDFVHVRSKADLDLLRDTDLFYSQIVLQHNPPPLITEILSSAFAGLRPGGLAYFQVPTYMNGYKFELETYLEHLRDQGMEMHAVPQKVIFDLGFERGLKTLDVRPDGSIGHFGEWISTCFLMQKASPKTPVGVTQKTQREPPASPATLSSVEAPRQRG